MGKSERARTVFDLVRLPPENIIYQNKLQPYKKPKTSRVFLVVY